MEKKNAFTITRARPEDAAALLDYLKIVGGETDNLSFGAEGVPLAPEEEQAYLRTPASIRSSWTGRRRSSCQPAYRGRRSRCILRFPRRMPL